MFGIYPKTVEILNHIFHKYDSIDEVILYGSRAKGNYSEGSDIDLSIKGSVSQDELYQILEEIDESSTPYLFDISIYHKLQSESLKEHIDRIGKTFYKKH
jgi:predicted nucleotidyltransferase